MSLLAAALVLAPQGPIQADAKLSEWGFSALEAIRRDFYIPESKLYAEELKPGGEKQPAFNWSVGVMLSALNSAAKLDSKYMPWLEEYATASRVYWNDKGPVPGYDVLPSPKPVDRYYDDNAWMVLSLVETYEVTGKKQYLTWAVEALRYVMSGEDPTGGGIYWRESDKKSKNACASGPAAAANVAVFRHTKNQRQLVDAIRLYNWTKRNLQDPEDYLFWDSISNDGKVNKTKWSYNTALMIRAAADLYGVTKNGAYVKDLKQMQAASAKKWLGENLKDEGRFAHLLLDAWIFQRTNAPVPRTDAAQADLRALYEPLAWLQHNGRDQAGWYGKRFDAPPSPQAESTSLLDQASAARAFLSAAFYFTAGA